MRVELWERSRLFARRLPPALVSLTLLMPHLAFSSPGELENLSASCQMTHVTSTSSWTFLSGFVPGEGIYTYFDPLGCGTPTYPFEMTSFSFMLGGATTQVSVDIVAYGLAVPGNSCGGPGAELFRTTVQVQGSSTSSQQYAFVPGELCFNGPFFIGLELHHSGLPGPGRQADNPPTAGACENYILSGGTFYDALSFGVVNYPAFWVVGQTGQCQATGACCDPYGGCAIMGRIDCEALGRSYLGDDTSCDPNPCTPAYGCEMTNTTGDASWIFQTGFVTGEGLYTYYDPEAYCGSQPYPFELGAFRFMLGGSTATQSVDVVVYDLIPGGDSCDGPGEELFRFTTSATGNSSVPNAFVFPDGQCCVNGPFYIGLEFHHSGAPGSGREVDGPTAATCLNWIRTQPDGVFHDATVYGMTRYPGYWVYGEPGSVCREPGACCDPFDVCTIMSQAACENSGGTYHGDGTTCDPSPCGPGGDCTLTNVTATSGWIFQGGFVSGEGIYTFFNPEADCGAPAYPYEISAFQFMLGGSSTQVSIDIVVYDAAISGDSCDGPGEELYRTTVQVQGNDTSPVQHGFQPGGLCVQGPFFMGVELHHNGLPGPARQSDNPPAAGLCQNYIWSGGAFWDALNMGFGFYPAFWVFGQTQQCQTSCCIGRVGDANGTGDCPDEVTLGDIMLMVDVKFISGDCSKLACVAEADVNQDGGADPTCEDHVTLGDIMFLVNFLFIAGPENATLPNCQANTVTDIDGNVYQTVTIGSQVWMAENLRVTHFRNGDPIPNVIDDATWSGLTSGAYCEYDDNIYVVDLFGRLYNWYAVSDIRGIAPEGWHVATDDDWKQLEIFLGMSPGEADAEMDRGTDEGGKLKDSSAGLWVAPNTGATDENGFAAKPSGSRNYEGFYDYATYRAYFWTSTPSYATTPWFRSLHYNHSRIYRYYNNWRLGYSVRCVKD
jgi:uncharacterized protein (TIGR02145 family)